MNRPPLAGITIVALEQAVAAPFATRQLADLGARVIKIERPGAGDFARAYDTKVRGIASHFTWLNRSKESLTLDIKRPESEGILQRLLARADVFIHNLAPGAVDRINLGVDPLRARFPRLIVCTVSGYGSSGPYQCRKAYDLLVQGETGFLSITGTAEAPAKAGISIADIAGGMYAYSGILTALLLRQRTGQGSALDVSLFDALGEWMGYPAYYTLYAAAPRRRAPAPATRPLLRTDHSPLATATLCTSVSRTIGSGAASARSCWSVPRWPATSGSHRTRSASRTARHCTRSSTASSPD